MTSPKTGIELIYLFSTWQLYALGHNAKEDSAPERQSEALHPTIVDLLIPDFNGAEPPGSGSKPSPKASRPASLSYR